jgi:hypothetical protein
MFLCVTHCCLAYSSETSFKPYNLTLGNVKTPNVRKFKKHPYRHSKSVESEDEKLDVDQRYHQWKFVH